MKQTSRWRKSSYSGNQGNCVEVALGSSNARVRDTKAREQGHLEVSADAWKALTERV